MLTCEGYKMFYGCATVTPPGDKYPASEIKGTWLYRPDVDRWYVNGHSFRPRYVSDFHEINPTISEEAQEAFDDLFSDAMDALDRMMACIEAPGARESNGC